MWIRGKSKRFALELPRIRCFGQAVQGSEGEANRCGLEGEIGLFGYQVAIRGATATSFTNTELATRTAQEPAQFDKVPLTNRTGRQSGGLLTFSPQFGAGQLRAGWHDG